MFQPPKSVRPSVGDRYGLSTADFERLTGLTSRNNPLEKTTRTRLPLKLLGTLTNGPSEWAMAAVLNTQTQQVKTLMVGDTVFDAQVAGIERKRLLLQRADHLELIDFETVTASAPASAFTVNKISESEYEIPRAQITRAISQLNQLAQDAHIVPVEQSSGQFAFKLLNVRPGSLYSQIGIESGDILSRINGYDLSSHEKALAAYLQLRDASNIELEVIRRGVAHKTRYAIRSFTPP